MTQSPPSDTAQGPPSLAPREDPAFDRRRLVVYLAGLVAFYALVVALVRPGPNDLDRVALGIMFAPTVGALAAWAFAHGRVRFGRLSRHVLLAFVPPAVILVVTAVAAAAGLADLHAEHLGALLALSPLLALVGSISAVGEEIGWRGFLWPLLRRHTGFWASSAVMLSVWWLYHLPAVLWWGYGSLGGLAAFTVAITGFVLFVGVLTDRSRAIWPSVLDARRLERPRRHGVLRLALGQGHSRVLRVRVPESAPVRERRRRLHRLPDLAGGVRVGRGHHDARDRCRRRAVARAPPGVPAGSRGRGRDHRTGLTRRASRGGVRLGVGVARAGASEGVADGREPPLVGGKSSLAWVACPSSGGKVGAGGTWGRGQRAASGSGPSTGASPVSPSRLVRHVTAVR